MNPEQITAIASEARRTANLSIIVSVSAMVINLINIGIIVGRSWHK